MLTLTLGDGGAVRVTVGRVAAGPAPSCAAAGSANAKPQSAAASGTSLRAVGLSRTINQLPSTQPSTINNHRPGRPCPSHYRSPSARPVRAKVEVDRHWHSLRRRLAQHQAPQHLFANRGIELWG